MIKNANDIAKFSFLIGDKSLSHSVWCLQLQFARGCRFKSCLLSIEKKKKKKTFCLGKKKIPWEATMRSRNKPQGLENLVH